MQERLAIMNAMKEEPNDIINENDELYGACRHNAMFHRYINKQATASTDQGINPERVTLSNDKRKKGRRARVVPPSSVNFCTIITNNGCASKARQIGSVSTVVK